MKHGGRVPAIALATLGVVMAMLAAIGPASGAGSWTPTALPVNTAENVDIVDVDCWSAGNCVAVGSAHINNTSQSGQVLVQETAGHWSEVAGANIKPAGGSPYGHLDSVSCPSAGFCVAVGRDGGDNSGSTGLIVTLKNGSWSAIDAPSVADEYQVWLSEVSCASTTSCAAVGYKSTSGGVTRGVIVTLSGTTWTSSEVTTPTLLDGHTLVDTRLASVSCWAAGSCTAVGRTGYDNGYSRGLITQLSSGTWTSTNAPEPSNAYTNTSMLAHVSCLATGHCVAAGEYGDLPSGNSNDELLTRSSGGTWSADQAPRPSGSPQVELDAVSCASDGTCAVAGSYIGDFNARFPAVFTSTDAGWDVLPVDLPDNAAGLPNWTTVSGLYDLSCTSSASCVASGFYNPDPSVSQGYFGLLVDVDPAAGTTDSSEAPLPSDAAAGYQDVGLTGVSCVDATHCTMAGRYTVGTDNQRSVGLAEELGGPAPPATAPKVGSLSPTKGPKKGGTKVTITGSGFTGKPTVLFGTKKGTKVTVKSPTKLTVLSPAHAKGTVTVKVKTAAGASKKSKKAKFTYQ